MATEQAAEVIDTTPDQAVVLVVVGAEVVILPRPPATALVALEGVEGAGNLAEEVSAQVAIKFNFLDS